MALPAAVSLLRRSPWYRTVSESFRPLFNVLALKFVLVGLIRLPHCPSHDGRYLAAWRGRNRGRWRADIRATLSGQYRFRTLENCRRSSCAMTRPLPARSRNGIEVETSQRPSAALLPSCLRDRG